MTFIAILMTRRAWHYCTDLNLLHRHLIVRVSSCQ